MIMPFDVNDAKSRGRRSAACLRSDPDTELKFTISNALLQNDSGTAKIGPCLFLDCIQWAQPQAQDKGRDNHANQRTERFGNPIRRIRSS